MREGSLKKNYKTCDQTMIASKAKPLKKPSQEPRLNVPMPLRRDSQTIIFNESGLKKQLDTQRALSKNHSKIQVGLIPHSQLGLIRHDSIEKLARFHQPANLNPFNGLVTFDKTKNQT